MDYSYKSIQGRIFELINQRERTITAVTSALSPIDIDTMLKIRIIDTISDAYKDELEALTKMANVAEWYELAKTAAQQIATEDIAAINQNGHNQNS